MRALLAAGSTFTVCALGGLGLGILVARATGSQLWVFGGLFAGMAVGAVSAVRLLLKS